MSKSDFDELASLSDLNCTQPNNNSDSEGEPTAESLRVEIIRLQKEVAEMKKLKRKAKSSKKAKKQKVDTDISSAENQESRIKKSFLNKNKTSQ